MTDLVNPLTPNPSPTQSGRGEYAARTGWLLSVLLAIAIAMVYVPTSAEWLSWAHGGADGGELAMASALGGVAHPPGYGLYTLVGGLFTHLPGMNPARGMVWFSILSAVGACLLTAIAVWSLLWERSRLRRSRVERTLPALMAGGVLAFSQAFWSQAVIIEVYTFMALLFCALLALATWQTPPAWGYALFGHVFGLALTHHLTALIWLPGLILLRKGWTSRNALYAALGAITGLYPYAILLLRAGHVPAADWGGIEIGLPAFFEHITGTLYRQFLQPVTVEALLGGIGAWLARLPDDLTVFGLVVVVNGLIAAVIDRRWRLLAASLIWCAGIAAFTGLYSAEDTQIPYRLPLSAVMAVFAGLGVAGLMQRRKDAKEKMTSPPTPLRRRGEAVLLTVGMVVVIGGMVVANREAVDVSRDDRARTFVLDTEVSFPDPAILVTGTSAGTFTLWYAQHIEDVGANWVIIDRNLWRFDWYREDLARVYPDLPAIPRGMTLEAWLRDPAFADMPIVSDAAMMPPPGRTSERVSEWYVIR